MGYALFFSALFFGLLTARAGTIADRGGIEPTPIVVSITFASMLCTFSIVVWGFIYLSWWLPILAFVVLSLVVGSVVTRGTWTSFYQAIPVTGLIAIGTTAAAWVVRGSAIGA